MKKKKRSMTLLEVMIVIFIIGIIGSIVGYNMKGSMEKARAFKRVRGSKKWQKYSHCSWQQKQQKKR